MSQIVLCADDSVTMQTVAEITFRATEFEYVGARSADEALKLAKEKTPAIILADAVMPGKTGYDLCLAAKSDPDLESIPVILLCGNSQAFDEARGGEVGADAHITKPWDSQVMIDKVKEVLDQASANGVAKPAGAEAAKPAAAVAAPAPAPAPVPAPPAPEPKPAPPVAAAEPKPVPPAPVAPPKPATPPVAAKPVIPTIPKPEPVVPDIKPAAAPKPAPPPARPAVARPATPPVAPAPPKPAPAPAPVAATMRPPMIKGTPSKRPVLPGLAGADAVPRSATMIGMPSLTLPAKGGVPGVTPVGSGSVASASAKVADAAAAAIPATAAKVAQEQGLDPDGPEMRALLKLSQDVVERIVWEVVPELAETIIRENLDKLTAQR